MIKLYSPESEVELAMLKGIFETASIPIFVHNDNFGSMKTGIQIELFNKKTIMVSEQHFEKARIIIENFIGNSEKSKPEQEASAKYSFWDKVRMVFEALVFGWVMPGQRRQKFQEKQENKSAVQPDNQADGK